MDSVKLLFVGDVVIRNKVKSEFLHPDFAAVLKAHDIVSCNFEAPVITPDSLPIRKAGPHVFQHECVFETLDKAGFNLYALANNHIYDYGVDALKNTLKALSGKDTIGAGIEFEDAYTPKVITRNGMTIGIFSFAEWGFGAFTESSEKNGGYAWVNHESVNFRIKQARESCDFVVVQVHAGVEEMDFPLPEWRTRYKELIDMGADVIIGHHPHVPQGWERYQGGLIFYSLGNFYFDAESNHPLWNVGYTVSLTLGKNHDIAFEVIPVIKKDSKIFVNHDQKFYNHLSQINGVIDSEDYLPLVNKEALKLWQTVYSRYYSFASNGIERSDSVYDLLKVIYRWLFKKDRTQANLFLLHNLKIESHRFTVERALKLMIDNV